MTDPRIPAALARCRASIPEWAGLCDSDFECAPPKGFSSFTMGVRCLANVGPSAVLYRQLEGKENAILDFENEKAVYLALAEIDVAAPCLAYARDHRIEGFYAGRSLTRHDLANPEVLTAIGRQLGRLHSLSPPVPDEPYFERLHRRWGPLAARTINDERHRFPEHEQEMCAELAGLLSNETLEKVRDFVPPGDMHFCHNDTYHGNVMKLDDGRIRLLDFEFACLNHPAFDFANLFAETVMRHQLPEYPHFGVAAPEYTREHIGAVVEGYLETTSRRGRNADELVEATEAMIPLSDFMYAMAALPLAVEPIQKIRFIPYSLQRYRRFEASWKARFG